MHPDMAQFVDSYTASEAESMHNDTESSYQTELLSAVVETGDDSGSEQEKRERRVYLTLPK
jgi:hypothetical protein